MKIIGVIPARYSSSRFPGKPLTLIAGKTMIEWVYQACRESKKLNDLVVATDDRRILDAVLSFNGKAVMTDTHHLNGTSRCIEVFNTYYSQDNKADWIINIQGDEPLITGKYIDELIENIESKRNAGIITLVRKLEDHVAAQNPNIVKCVFDRNHRALYFSRSPIPFYRGPSRQEYFQHVGIYAYSSKILMSLSELTESPLESAEMLEQLRWLENSIDIHVGITQYESHAVDVPGDVMLVERVLKKK
ncbi:MAG: 3-deoxy-manno-octulosonate cytidylyltransferase [Saprospiraceae bacterium]